MNTGRISITRATSKDQSQTSPGACVSVLAAANCAWYEIQRKLEDAIWPRKFAQFSDGLETMKDRLAAIR